MTFKKIKQIAGLLAFCTFTVLKATGSDIDIMWLIVPAIIMGLDKEHIESAKEIINFKK
jgi:hypothetical protein